MDEDNGPNPNFPAYVMNISLRDSQPLTPYYLPLQKRRRTEAPEDRIRVIPSGGQDLLRGVWPAPGDSDVLPLLRADPYCDKL